MNDSDLLKQLSKLDADVKVVVFRLDNTDEDIKEIKEEQRHSRRLIVASLFTVVMTLAVALISLLTDAGAAPG